MKKKKILFGSLALAALATLAACGGGNESQTTTPAPTPTSTAEVVPTTTADVPSTTSQTPATTSEQSAVKVNVTLKNVDPFDETKQEVKEVTLDQTDATTGEKYGILTVADPTNEYKTFAGWFLDANFSQAADKTNITEAVTFFAKWDALYEEVKNGLGANEGLTSFNVACERAGGSNPITGQVVLSKDLTIGSFTLLQNGKMRFELKNGNPVVNTQGGNIKVTLSGEGTNNEIHANGLMASSDKTDKVCLYKIKSVAEDGTITLEDNPVAETDDISGSGATVEFEWKNLAAGDYVIKSGKTQGISIQFLNLWAVEKREKSPATSLELETTGVQKYLKGVDTEFDPTGLAVKAVYLNGSKKAVDQSDLLIDSSAVDFTTPGEYEVTIKHKTLELGEVKQSVFVLDAKELEVQDYILNSQVTQPLQVVYLKGATFEPKNLAVVAKAEATNKAGQKVTGEFTLSSSNYFIGSPALAEAGEKEITVTFGDVSTSYKIQVIDSKLTGTKAVYVTVNPENTAVAVDGENATAKTITQALQILELSELSANAQKFVYIAPGTYNEKLEIKLPNVILLNAYASSGLEAAPKGENEAIIVYDAMSGKTDANGLSHGTIGSATVSVRANATDFLAYGITFKNYYNTHDLYTESKAISSNTQAVALLVEADRSQVVCCNISSYHDTLYARNGRQLYWKTYIEGRTDYIFGDSDVTALFEDCIIHTLGANQDKNGGYVACNKGSDSAFGYVFDRCVFEADAPTEDGKGVANGTVSLGRTWDEGMRLYIVNSTISAAYAKTDFGHGEPVEEGSTSLKNPRYTEMNKGKSPAKNNIKEYNNTGAGALTKAEAANYTSVEVLETLNRAQTIIDMFSATDKLKYAYTWPVAKNVMGLVSEDDPEEIKVTFVVSEAVSPKMDWYKGFKFSEAFAKELLASSGVEGSIQGFYSDAAKTTAFNFGQAFTQDTTLYVKVSASAEVVDLTEFKGYEYNTQTDWKVTTSGNQKISPTIGGTKDSADAVNCPKFAVNEGIKNVTKFAKGAYQIDLEMLSASTGTSNSINATVNLYAEDGTTLVKTATWEGVTVSKLTKKSTISITSDTEFYFVEVLYSGNVATKDFGIYSLTGKVYFAGEGQTTPVANKITQLDTSKLDSKVTAGTVVSGIFTIYGKADGTAVSVSNVHTSFATVDNKATTITKVLKLNAGKAVAGSSAANCVVITLDSQATINIVATKKSATSNAKLVLYNAEGTKVKESDGIDAFEATNINTITFENVAAGTYYLGASADGFYLFDLQVVQAASQEANA